jgi:replicative DNA helicase
LDIARSAAIKHKMASVVFSLEMSRTEITMRLLSAEAGIQLQHMRKGTMRDEDWTRLASTMGKVSDAPLFIDDSPNMSLMEIRAKCRRLKQRHNLKLVIIDYLQLMSSGKRVESRQQEVSEFSRALKLLAKELEVPVIAISQLNRGPEQRTDKKPAMSDLRESGCLTAETRVLRADTGAEASLGQLYAERAKDVPVWALDEKLRYVTRPLTHVFPTGVKPVFKLTLASGKTVRATENHPFLTYAGWSALGDLRTGTRLAVPRHVPAPELHEPWQDDAEVVAAAAALDVPDSLFHASKRQIALYLRAVASLRGSVSLTEGSVTVARASGQAIAGLSRLLLRFGISTEQRAEGSLACLAVEDSDSRRRFLREIGFVPGPLTEVADLMLGELAGRDGGRGPATLRESLADAVGDVDSAGGEALASVATCLDEADLDLHAVNDVLWDEVVSIESDGVEEVYDATVLGAHNFIANGVAVHNSIEQDADMVILLHREAAYEKDSPREGEADLIVAKHRNGPTDTIVVAFQGHFSRFTNMATNF